ncbi:DUF262 domain-containing protein [Corynebacterium xerosis]|uniref:DUF262 domain-containing protein n=1 Tax=Corynebacterium xerosis TaxID=1725 RepID=UPI0036734FE9
MRGEVKPLWYQYDSQSRKLVIPVYQRNYDWQLKHCERLFDDLEEVIEEDRPKHFFGAIVGKPETGFEWIVIDGQQRLTTVSLLILAIADAIDAGSLEYEDKGLGDTLRKSYLYSGSENRPGGKIHGKLKLKPVKDDLRAYEHLFGPESGYIESSNVTRNYKYFRKRLEGTDFTAEQIWEAVKRLDAMVLDLEQFDNPQRIFESLNSTGLGLSEADKIRNLVLMDKSHAEQEFLYETYWNPLERNVDFHTDWFIRWYLTVKMSRTARMDAVYDTFKSFLVKEVAAGATVQGVLEEMFNYSKHLRDMETAETGDSALDIAFKRFNLIRGDVVLPLTLPIFRDYRNGEISSGEVLGFLRVIETHIARRTVSSVAANALNKIYATIYHEIHRMRTSDATVLHVFVYLLRRRDTTSGRIPGDEEFAEAFSTRNFYRLSSSQKAYFFDVLENGDSKDRSDIVEALDRGDVTIEHIMPQTLSASWKKEIGEEFEEVHGRWINRVGNLTVSGYNSSYSNSSFVQKRDMEHGFRNTPYRLNELVRDKERWGVEELQARNDDLVAKALSYWALPETTFVPERPPLPTESLGAEVSLRGRSVTAFIFGDERKTVSNWSDMLLQLLRILAQDYQTELIKFSEKTELLIFSESSSDVIERGSRRVNEALILRVPTGTEQKISFLRRVFHYLGLDQDELVFVLKPAGDELNFKESVDEVVAPDSMYAPLLKFLPELDEFAGQSLSVDDTVNLRGQFKEDFGSFVPDRPWKSVEAKGRDQIVRYGESEGGVVTDRGILEHIQWVLEASDMFIPTMFHDCIVDGTFARWIRALG